MFSTKCLGKCSSPRNSKCLEKVKLKPPRKNNTHSSKPPIKQSKTGRFSFLHSSFFNNPVPGIASYWNGMWHFMLWRSKKSENGWGIGAKKRLKTFTPPKTNMTGWKIHQEWVDVFPIEKLVIFQRSSCDRELRGVFKRWKRPETLKNWQESFSWSRSTSIGWPTAEWIVFGLDGHLGFYRHTQQGNRVLCFQGYWVRGSDSAVEPWIYLYEFACCTQASVIRHDLCFKPRRWQFFTPIHRWEMESNPISRFAYVS